MTRTPVLETIETPKAAVSSTYHGVTVTEHYRWLEDAASDQTRAWTMAQDRRTRDYLQSLPSYGAVRRRAEEILKSEAVMYDALRRAGSAYFALKHQPPKQQPFLVALACAQFLVDSHVTTSDRLAIIGGSLDQRVSELADVYAFLFDSLGIDYHPAAGRPER